MKKKLVEYLINYVDREEEIRGRTAMLDDLPKILEEGIDAFESTQQMVVDIHPECPLDTITDNAGDDK